MTIDVHGHFVPVINDPALAKFFDLRPNDSGGVDMYILGENFSTCEPELINLSKQIEDMDREGIDLRLLCIPPFLFHYAEDNALGWCKFVNDEMRKRIEDFSERFLLLGTLPMQRISEACDELQRIMSFDEFAGIEIGSNINGIEISDPAYFPLWKIVEELNAFVLIHPAYVLESPRLKKHYLRNLVGNPLDTTIAAFSLISGGVMDRFPSLKICLSHGGGYLALAVSRFDHGYKVRPELKDFSEPPSEIAKKFYYDTVMHDPRSIEFVAGRFGEGQVLMGTDYPFDMGDSEPLKTVGSLRFPDAIKEKITCRNFKSILRKVS